MHLRLGQAARHDAQDQTSRHSQCRCRFHAQSDRLQSNPHSQTAGGVARVRSQREKLLPASEHTLTAQPSDPAKDGKCATFQVLQQTASEGHTRSGFGFLKVSSTGFIAHWAMNVGSCSLRKGAMTKAAANANN